MLPEEGEGDLRGRDPLTPDWPTKIYLIPPNRILARAWGFEARGRESSR